MPEGLFSVFVNPLLPPNSVALGRLVVDIKEPGKDFCPSKDVSVKNDDIVVNLSTRVHSVLSNSGGTRFHASLTKFLRPFFNSDRSGQLTMMAAESKSYKLLNSRLYLQ